MKPRRFAADRVPLLYLAISVPGGVSVVVHDFHVFRAADCPPETHAPLPVDAYAVLAGAIVLQGLQLVARW
jgi:hypothetical protein